MPAGFTHILLAKTFNENAIFNDFEDEDILKAYLDSSIDYFQLGAIGPDLPYSQLANPFNKNETKIADKFHYEKTNQIPILALGKVREIEDEMKKVEAFSFFCGYISHMVADGIIHPFVRDKVGPYKKNSEKHRLLEMRLDVLFLEYLTKSSGNIAEINNSKIQDQLGNASKNFDDIAAIFADVINKVHNSGVDGAVVTEWAQDMEFLFETAANEHNQYYAFVPLIAGLLYKNTEELLNTKDKDLFLGKNEAIDRAMNFRGRDTHFFNDCIPTYYKALSPILRRAYEYVFNNSEVLTDRELPAINLDTGRLLKHKLGYDLDQAAVYWEKA